jgi:hypothetical protein
VDAEEHTERIIQLIEFIVESPRVSKDLKHYVLDELAGLIIGGCSVYITQWRCRLEDRQKAREDRWDRAMKEFVHELEWIDLP